MMKETRLKSRVCIKEITGLYFYEKFFSKRQASLNEVMFHAEREFSKNKKIKQS